MRGTVISLAAVVGLVAFVLWTLRSKEPLVDLRLFKNPNFARVAEAMGAKGIRLEEPGDVRDALAEALAHKDGPVVVDAVVDPLALSLPSHVPFHTAKGFTLSMAKQVLSGRLDTVIKTMEQNVRLV